MYPYICVCVSCSNPQTNRKIASYQKILCLSFWCHYSYCYYLLRYYTIYIYIHSINITINLTTSTLLRDVKYDVYRYIYICCLCMYTSACFITTMIANNCKKSKLLLLHVSCETNQPSCRMHKSPAPPACRVNPVRWALAAPLLRRNPRTLGNAEEWTTELSHFFFKIIINHHKSINPKCVILCSIAWILNQQNVIYYNLLMT